MVALIDELSRELRPPLTAEAAVVEADRCLECGGAHAPAPCVVGCPANVDVPRLRRRHRSRRSGDGSAARSSPRTSSAGPARACARSRCSASRIACLIHEGRPPIEIGALQRYATDWAYRNGVPLRAAAPPNGKSRGRDRRGPGRTGRSGRARSARLRRNGLRRARRDRRARPLRDRALPADERAAARRGAAARRARRGRSASARESTPRASRSSRAEVDAIVLAVGMGADLDVTYEGDDLDGVWESLPFIERLKTGEPPAVGERVAVIGGGNTAVDVAVEAKRLGADVSLLLYRRTEQEMPAYEHEVELARDEGVEIRFLTSPVGFVGDERVEGVRCAEMRLGAPDDTRPPPAGAVPGQRVRRSRSTPWSRRSASGRETSSASLLDVVDQDGRTRTRRSSPPETPSTAARVSCRPSRRPSAPSRRSRRRCDERDDRDPLARARRPGREDRCRRSSRWRCCAPGRACRRSPSTGPSAAARRCARTRASRIARSAVTTRSRTPMSSSCSSHRSSTRRAWRTGCAPDGFVVFNGEESPPRARRRRRALHSRARLATTFGSGFVNIVMLGAVAAELGEPPLADLQDAAVETLGRKVEADDVRRALSEGYAWLS